MNYLAMSYDREATRPLRCSVLPYDTLNLKILTIHAMPAESSWHCALQRLSECSLSTHAARAFIRQSRRNRTPTECSDLKGIRRDR